MLKLKFPIGSIVHLYTDFGSSYSGKVIVADENSVTLVFQTLLADDNFFSDDHIREISSQFVVNDKTMDIGTPLTLDRSRVVGWQYFEIKIGENTRYTGLPSISEWENETEKLNVFSTQFGGSLICKGSGPDIDS